MIRILHRPGGANVQASTETDRPDRGVDLTIARDCLHLMLLEYGDVRIETLRQLLKLTNNAERQFSHLCRHRPRA